MKRTLNLFVILIFGVVLFASCSLIPETPDDIAEKIWQAHDGSSEGYYLYFTQSQKVIKAERYFTIMLSNIGSKYDPSSSISDEGGLVYFAALTKIGTERDNYFNGSQAKKLLINIYEYPLRSPGEPLYNNGDNIDRSVKMLTNEPGPEINTPQTSTTVHRYGYNFYLTWPEENNLQKGNYYGGRIVDNEGNRLVVILPAFIHK